jgi:hypothetical protein
MSSLILLYVYMIRVVYIYSVYNLRERILGQIMGLVKTLHLIDPPIIIQNTKILDPTKEINKCLR